MWHLKIELVNQEKGHGHNSPKNSWSVFSKFFPR